MGQLVDGAWTTENLNHHSKDGHFKRNQSTFRNWVTADGSAGPSGDGGFKAEAGRYHLYAAYACPWAHRALIFRTLKGLQEMIDVSFVHWFMGEEGWSFKRDADGIVGDMLHGSDFLHQVYTKADPEFTGRVTVPILWDKQKGTIVSNESSEIIRMFNSAFDDLGALPGDYYRQDKRAEIDPLNDRIYETVNNGVYRCGFASAQAAYDEAVTPLFDTLDFLEERLAQHRYLTGDSLTEADWRLFPTLLRFDPVYTVHFKCSARRLIDYPNLWAYARDLYQQPGIAETINMDHTRWHYYQSHESVNPTRIVAHAPRVDWLEPHGRESL